jgi:hypothetical protein
MLAEKSKKRLWPKPRAPVSEAFEAYADGTRIQYSGGLSEAGPELEPFEAE